MNRSVDPEAAEPDTELQKIALVQISISLLQEYHHHTVHYATTS